MNVGQSNEIIFTFNLYKYHDIINSKHHNQGKTDQNAQVNICFWSNWVS